MRRYTLGAPTGPDQATEPTRDGYLIARLLDENGWSVFVWKPFAGEPGIVVQAAHRYADVPPIKLSGSSLADCAPALLVQASKHLPAIAEARSRAADRTIDLS